jgi:hypothetical protein
MHVDSSGPKRQNTRSTGSKDEQRCVMGLKTHWEQDCRQAARIPELHKPGMTPRCCQRWGQQGLQLAYLGPKTLPLGAQCVPTQNIHSYHLEQSSHSVCHDAGEEPL